MVGVGLTRGHTWTHRSTGLSDTIPHRISVLTSVSEVSGPQAALWVYRHPSIASQRSQPHGTHQTSQREPRKISQWELILPCHCACGDGPWCSAAPCTPKSCGHSCARACCDSACVTHARTCIAAVPAPAATAAAPALVASRPSWSTRAHWACTSACRRPRIKGLAP